MSKEIKRIPENWAAIEEIEQRIKEKTGDPEARFNAATFFFGKAGRQLLIRAMYRKKTKQGFTKSYFDMMVVAEFCPFSGLPLNEGEAADRMKELEEKAAKWDALAEKLAEYYSDEHKDGDGLLLDIGEHTARAFGWM